MNGVEKVVNGVTALGTIIMHIVCLATSEIHDGLIQRVRLQLSAAAHAINFHRLTDANYVKIHKA